MNTLENHDIIHIGFPKTGTKWFQKQLFPKVKNSIFINLNKLKTSIIEPNTLEYSKKFNRLVLFEDERLIISDENLLGSIQVGGMQRLHTKEMAHRLKHLFPEAQIIIFLRNQTGLIASAYLQYIKMGGNYSEKRYLFDKDYSFTGKRKLFSFDFFKYDELVDYYQKLFGKDKVFVYLYEDFALSPKYFVEKLIKKHEFEVDLSDLNFEPINERYGKIMVILSKILSSFTKRPLIFKYYLIHIPKWHYISRELKRYISSKKLFGRKQTDEQVLGQKTVQYIKSYYQSSNKNLSELVGYDEKLIEYGYLEKT